MADRIIGAANGLGFDLLRSLAADAPNSNVAVSPYSVAVALGLVHMGAAGSTADAMAAAMQLSGIDSDTVGLTHAWVLNRVRCSGVEGTDVRIANGLWLAALLEPRADYLARARSQYRAEVAALDFSAGDAAAPINAWVSERTAGKIENAIARVPANAALIVVNTVYFKGLWTVPFDPALTADAAFTREDGTEKTVPLMQLPPDAGDIAYFDGDGFQSLRLAYGDDETQKLHMALFLPTPGRPLEPLIAGLDAGAWDDWRDRYRFLEGEVRLPRFTLEWKGSLVAALSALGMRPAFDPLVADFSGLSARGRDIVIDDVAHSVFVAVDEQGTEAAASTSITATVESYEEPFVFIADRPFLWAIVDDETGAVLFLGAVYDP